MKTQNLLCLLMATFMCACSSNSDEPAPTPEVKKVPINLSLGVESRATDSSFEPDDKIGLYVVNYVSGVAGTLQNSGNQVDNMRFTFASGVWTPDTKIYWKDETTKADFYGFYPYASVTNVQSHTFDLKEDQSTLANYKASDFLWGKAAGISPTESAVSITTKHIFSNAIIKVEAGEGFTAEALAAATVSVKLGQVKTQATINLTTGVATASGAAKQVIPLKETDSYRALIIPQTIAANDFIIVTVNGQDYKLNKEFTFVANQKHTFTVKVSRTSNGINVNIGSWDTDDTDHGGVAN